MGGWGGSASIAPALPMPMTPSADAAGGGGIIAGHGQEWTSLSLSKSMPQMPADNYGSGIVSPHQPPMRKPGSALWDRVVEFCEAQRFLEAYKQVIAEPE